MQVKVNRLNPDVSLPEYQTSHSACCDAHAIESAMIPAKGWAMINTGLTMEVPTGYELQVRSRSGLAVKQGVFILNSPGCVDEDFRGNVKVIAANLSDVPVQVNVGDRIAQFVLVKVERIEWLEVLLSELSETERGSGGFGHTGK